MSNDPEQESSRRALLKAQAKQLGREWHDIAFPQGYEPWFAAADHMPPFDPAKTQYDPVNAWWLLELCRLSYTPDRKEGTRPWSRFDRDPHLQPTPFRELHSIHKTGTHAAIYRHDPTAATVLCFRGTTKFRQWVMNLSTIPVRWNADGHREVARRKAYVHQGFSILFERIWPLVEPLLREQPRPWVITGHSLGGALALMSAAMCSPDLLYTFGCPRVGNPAFGKCISDHKLTNHRIVNHHDIVTLLPHAVETFAPYDFRHHGDPVHLRADDVDWQPSRPLTFLAQTFKSTSPPECIVDHTPAAYEKSLREQIAEAGPPF